jgi:hypothetical protein
MKANKLERVVRGNRRKIKSLENYLVLVAFVSVCNTLVIIALVLWG